MNNANHFKGDTQAVEVCHEIKYKHDVEANQTKADTRAYEVCHKWTDTQVKGSEPKRDRHPNEESVPG